MAGPRAADRAMPEKETRVDRCPAADLAMRGSCSARPQAVALFPLNYEEAAAPLAVSVLAHCRAMLPRAAAELPPAKRGAPKSPWWAATFLPRQAALACAQRNVGSLIRLPHRYCRQSARGVRCCRGGRVLLFDLCQSRRHQLPPAVAADAV